MTPLLLAAVAAVPLFVLARRWEFAGRPDRYVALVIAFLLLECLLYPVQADVPVGVFRIPALGGGLPTLNYLVIIGLVGRATVRPLPQRISTTGVLWLVTFGWLVVAGLIGIVVGHSATLVLFSASSLVGLFGAVLLVSGCDARRLVDLVRSPLVVPLGLLVALVLMNQAGESPGTFLGADLGIIHVDTASVFVAVGTFVVLVEWSSRTRHRWAAWAAVPLLATPFAISQRATLVQLVATVLVVGWAMTRPAWTGRIHVARLQLLKGVLVVVAVLLVGLMVQLSDSDASAPFADYYADTFTSRNQVLSAQARRDSFAVGIDQWADAWPYGYGLGHTYRIVRPFGTGLQQPATFDNVPLDLLVRSGLVGFGLFTAAFALTLRDGLRAWRRHADGTVAALALAAVAVLIGLGSKALFESILEKGKIAVLLGLCAGVVAAAARSLTSPAPAPTLPPVPAPQGATSWT